MPNLKETILGNLGSQHVGNASALSVPSCLGFSLHLGSSWMLGEASPQTPGFILSFPYVLL